MPCPILCYYCKTKYEILTILANLENEVMFVEIGIFHQLGR